MTKKWKIILSVFEIFLIWMGVFYTLQEAFAVDGITYGPEYVFFQGSSYSGIGIDALDSIRFVAVHTQLSGSYTPGAVIGTVSGNAISYSSSYDFNGLNAVSVAALDSTHFVVASRTGHGGSTQIGSVSGNVISFGPAVSYGIDDTTSAMEQSVIALDSTHFVICHTENELGGFYGYKGQTILGTVSGNNISLSGPFTFFGPGYGAMENSAVALDSSRFVISYWTDGGNKSRVGTVSGNTILFGPESTFYSGGGSREIWADGLDNNKFVVAFSALRDKYTGEARIGTVSGNNISFGPESIFWRSGALYQISTTALDSSRFAVAYRPDDDFDYGRDIIGTVSGDTISFGPESIFNYGGTGGAGYNDQEPGIDITTLSSSKFVTAYYDTGNSEYGTAIIGATFTINPPTVSTNSATSITSSSATLNGILTNMGGVGSCNVWFQWGTSTNYGSETTHTIKNATGVFSANITGLSPGTTYYFRAAAENPRGIVYGGNLSFPTLTFSPIVQSNPAENITRASALLKGNITSTGGESVTERGFDWGTAQNGPYPNSWTETGSFGTGVFSYNVTNLTQNTTYYFKAKAKNSIGWGYGGELSFKTTLFDPPSVSTNEASDIQATQSTLNGTLTAMGGVGSCNVWFQWGTSTNYGSETTHTIKNATGVFSANITGLSPGTTYYFRAAAENPGGIVYGGNLSFLATNNIQSTSPYATAYSFQRKTWYDATSKVYWISFHADANNRIEFWYSTDGYSWTENASARIPADTNDFSIEADSNNAFIVYTDGDDVKANKATSYPGTSFGWGVSPYTVYDRGIWWDASWSKRKQLTISAAAGNGVSSGYSVKFTASGADAADIYNDSLASGNDFRVAYYNGSTWTELDRDLVTFTSSSIEVWFKLQAAITAGSSDTNYYLYYGNSGAGSPPATLSNVYEFWEPFTNLTNWTNYRGTPSVSGGILTLDPSEATHSNSSWGTGHRLEIYAKPNETNKRDDIGFRSVDADFGTASGNGIGYQIYENTYYYADTIAAGSGPTQTQIGTYTAAYATWAFNWLSGSAKFYTNGVLKATHTANVPSASCYVYLASRNASGGTVLVDWVKVRDLVATEPMVAAGTETGEGGQYRYPVIARDSNSNIWTAVSNHSGSSYLYKAVQSTTANQISAWNSASTLDTSANSNKYGVIVPLLAGNMYSVWADGAAIEGKAYNGTNWDSSITSIATGVNDITKNVSAVSDSLGNVHLVYIDSLGNVKYREYTGSWQPAVTLDSNTTNEYPTVSINSPDKNLYVFWIRDSRIYYKKGITPYNLANWDALSTEWQSLGINKNITSGYQDFGSFSIFAEWTKGVSSPYTIAFDKINLLGNLPEAQNLSVDTPNSTDYCGIIAYPPVRTRWQFVGVNPEDTQSAFEIKVFKQNDNSLVADTGKILNDSNSYVFQESGKQLAWNTAYNWQIMVWDNYDVASNWASSPTFSTIVHAYPTSNFAWIPEKPLVNQQVQFTDQSIAYGATINSWSWVFENGNPPTSTDRNPIIAFTAPGAGGQNQVTLTAGDSENSCQAQRSVRVSLPAPEWIEIRGF